MTLPSAGQTNSAPSGSNSGNAATAAPLQGVAGQIAGLFRTFAPAVAAGTTAFVEKATAGAKESQQGASAARVAGNVRRRGAMAGGVKGASNVDRSQAARRKAELERQLADLNAQETRMEPTTATTATGRRVPGSLQPGGGPKQRAASATSGTRANEGRSGTTRLVSQPLWGSGAGAEENSDDLSDDATAAGIAGKSEKSALSGSYAVLDKADVPPGRHQQGSRGPAAGARLQKKAPASSVGKKAGTAVQQRDLPTPPPEGEQGWGAWLRGGTPAAAQAEIAPSDAKKAQ